jgi:hypothetical protein
MVLSTTLRTQGRAASSRIANGFRAKRLQTFIHLVDDVLSARPGACRIIDLGGSKTYWTDLQDVWQKRNIEITLVNIDGANESDGRFTYVRGDARDLHSFADNSFDIAHSNSVIEHVGRWSDRQRMAAEVRRLAPSYFVQTPNYWFPYEPHLCLPFVHWLPQPLQRRLLMARSSRYFDRAKTVDDAYAILDGLGLLDAVDMQALFPDAELRREVVGPLTKSFVAVRRRSGT